MSSLSLRGTAQEVKGNLHGLERHDMSRTPNTLRHKRRHGFTTLPNTVISDPRLSCKALALLLKGLSCKDGWRFTLDYFVQTSKDGREGIQSGLRELEEVGYLRRYQERDESGKLGGMVYEFRDYADDEVSPGNDPDGTVYGKPVYGKPAPKKEHREEEQDKNKDMSAKASENEPDCEAPTPTRHPSDSATAPSEMSGESGVLSQEGPREGKVTLSRGGRLGMLGDKRVSGKSEPPSEGSRPAPQSNEPLTEAVSAPPRPRSGVRNGQVAATPAEAPPRPAQRAHEDRAWFYETWNRGKPQRSPGLTSNREVDRRIKTEVKQLGRDEFRRKVELALRFVNASEFHRDQRPCPAITLLRHLDTYAEQAESPALTPAEAGPGRGVIKAGDLLVYEGWASPVTVEVVRPPTAHSPNVVARTLDDEAEVIQDALLKFRAVPS